MGALADLQSRLRQAAEHYMRADPAHNLAHLDRVWQNAQQIADANTNMRVLMAGAYLHDLVNLPKDHPDRSRASHQSADAAWPILQDLGYSNEESRAVQHAIIAHSFSAGVSPKTHEARVLRDADRLDALGAVGIARVFSVSGALGRTLYDPTNPFGKNRDLDESRFTIEHWYTKLLKLQHQMMTPAGKSLAKERTEFMVAYLEQFADEIGSPHHHATED